MITVKGVKGGEKINARLEEMRRNAKSLHVRAGVLEGAKYADGTPVAVVAMAQEFGVAEHGLPPRSFMRSTVIQRYKAWVQGFAQELKSGNMNAETALARLGAVMADDFKKQIAAMTQPALKPATIRRKKHSKLLIGGGVSRGQLMRSLSWDVQGGASE